MCLRSFGKPTVTSAPVTSAPFTSTPLSERGRSELRDPDGCLSAAEDNHRDIKQEFITTLSQWLTEMWQTNSTSTRDDEIGYWLKLAAFILRKRDIKLGGVQ
jgi:hypothetical protein